MSKGFIFMLDLVFSIVIILIALVFIFDVNFPKVSHMQSDLIFDSANNFYTGSNDTTNGNVCIDYELYDGTQITNCKVVS